MELRILFRIGDKKMSAQMGPGTRFLFGRFEMNKAILAATAAFAALAFAPAAQAAVSVTCPQIVGSASCSFNQTVGTGFFGNSFAKGPAQVIAFDDTYNLILDASSAMYKLSITLTNTISVGGPISFTLHELLNSTPVKLGDVDGGGVANDFIVGPGVYSLHFAGGAAVNLASGASYSGTIDVAPVPEPASWAMMIAGIAAVGTAMRRRAHTARVAFS
jgi:hypothetical protein